MKKILVSLTAVALAVMSVCAEEHELPGVATNQAPYRLWGYSFSQWIGSKYFGTIFGGTFYPGPMTFTDGAASRQNHFGSFIGSQGGALTFDLSIGQKLDRLNQYNRDGGNEYDMTIDQTFKFGTNSFQVLADAGVCYLAIHDLNRSTDDAFEEFVRLDFPVMANRPGGPICQFYTEAFHYHKVGNGLQNEGWITYHGIIRNQGLGLKLFGQELVLVIDYRIGVNAGVYGSRAGVEYHRLGFTAPYNLGKGWPIALSGVLQTPGAPDRTYVHKSEIFGTSFLKYSF